MTEATPSAICDDLVAILKASTTLAIANVLYGPPEGVPHGLHAWVRYGPVEYEWGMFTVAHPEIRITVSVERNSQYRSEYRLVTDAAQRVVQALSGPILLADQAPITGVSVSEAGGTSYASQPDALMAAVVTLAIENKESNTGV